MKLILTNAVSLNVGDAAIVMAMKRAFDSLWGGRIEWMLCGTRPGAAARYYPDLPFRDMSYTALTGDGPANGLRARMGRAASRFVPFCLSRGSGDFRRWLLPADLRRHVGECAGADAMISCGGTYLVERYELAPRLLEFTVAERLGIPLVFYTQSLGPFRSRKIRRDLKRAFDYASLIFLRDQLSLDHVRALGVDSRKCSVHADAVFGLYEENAKPTPSHSGPLRVAISVREWRHFRREPWRQGMERYAKATAAVVEHLVRRYDARITFVSTCQGIPEYRTDDAAVATAICDRYVPEGIRPRVTVDSAFRHPADLVQHLRSFDFTLSTRMHFAILSMMAGVPVFAVANDFKTQELFKSIGLEDWVEDIETVSPESLVLGVDKVQTRVEAAREQIRSQLLKLKASALEPAAKTLAMLRQEPPAGYHADRTP